MKAESKITSEPAIIKEWAEQRGGKPSHIIGTGEGDDPGLLRINFPGRKESNLEDISWEDFFEKMDKNNLTFLYQEKTATGKVSRFNKIIRKDGNRKPVRKPSAKKRKKVSE
ncbi:MAG: hypothetical protein ACJ75J_08075 [Cytophagaceae bacterium]